MSETEKAWPDDPTPRLSHQIPALVRLAVAMRDDVTMLRILEEPELAARTLDLVVDVRRSIERRRTLLRAIENGQTCLACFGSGKGLWEQPCGGCHGTGRREVGHATG